MHGEILQDAWIASPNDAPLYTAHVW